MYNHKITLYTTRFDDSHHPILVKKQTFETEVYPAYDSQIANFKLLKDVFSHHRETEEVVYELCYDSKFHFLGIFEVSRGTSDHASISVKSIYRNALLCNAAYIIIAHNHPSGDATPSESDDKMFINTLAAGNMIGIQLVDSIIIAEDGCYSYTEDGRAEQLLCGSPA